MEKVKEIFKAKKLDIWVIYICFILLAYSIVVGSPLKHNTGIIDLITLITFILYFIINLVRNKKFKIVKGKLDIFVIMLVFSSYIALIFRSYSNLQATIEYIIKYMALFSLYIIIRDFIKKDKKYINYIIVTIVTSGIYIFFVGLDNITYNITEKLMQAVGNVIVRNDDKRFMSVFGYANTCSILNILISILAIGKYINSTNKKERIFYNVVIFLNLTAVIISYSRSVWLIAGLVYLILIFIFKNKRIEYIELLLRTGILSGIYSLITIKSINQNSYLFVWILLIVFILLTVISNLISKKTVTFMGKIKFRYYIIILITIVLVIAIVICVGMQMTAPLVIFDNIYTKKVPTQDINDVLPNTKYKFEFDIDSKVAFEDKNIYEIEICERNIYDDILKTHKIEFGSFDGIKELEFETTEYTHKFLIRFNSDSRAAQRGLTINSMKINGEERAVNYKFLPIRLVDKIKDIKLDTISVRGRFEYIEESIKLIGKYGLLGIGADGWKDRRVEVQNYYDTVNEPHSYILEVFCEFGIIGFIALVSIFIYLLRKFIQELKKDNKDLIRISILLAIIVLFIHSTIDFELSFMYMLVVLFALLAMTHDEEKNYKIVDIVAKVLIFVLLAFAVYFDSRVCVSKYIKTEEDPYSQEYIYSRIQTGESFKKDVDEMISRRRYVSHINEFENLIYSKELNEDEYYKIYEVLKGEEYLLQDNVYMKVREIELYKEILNNLDKNIERYNNCKNSIIQEIENTKELLDEPEKCRLSFEEIELYEKDLEQIKEEVER